MGRLGVDRIADIERAIRAHAVWLAELRRTLADAQRVPEVAAIRADDACEFGRWLYGPQLSDGERERGAYLAVLRLHAEFHELAAHVVELGASGRRLEAYTMLYGDCVTLSGKLVIAMRAWQTDLLRSFGS